MKEEQSPRDINELLANAVATYNAMTPVEKALHDAAQRRSFIRGQVGHDPGPDVLAEEVTRLRSALKQAERALEFFIKAEDEAAAHGGLKDCRDNDGGFYQSAWMESLIDKARTMVSPGLAAAPDTR